MFPAPAGINRVRRLIIVIMDGVPRASGDKPQFLHMAYSLQGCSPRQRG
ncbi:TPA: hypothetical protein JLV29_004719 [Escherichia coli]|nr:hypothetical protein [Escherichia coli]